MPTKHIPEETWAKVEEATVEAVSETKRPFTPTEILNLLIIRGLVEMKKEDWRKIELLV